MREIELTQGKAAIVDDGDYAALSRSKWQAKRGKAGAWYARRTVGKWPFQRVMWMHRAIMEMHGVDIAGLEVDHRNGDGLDNRFENLRVATHAQNVQNQRVRADNTSGLKGVSWDSRHDRWAAGIEVGGVHRHLGYFVNKAEAGAAYRRAARELHGDFANIG
jgi:hypothetical protein